VDWDGSGTVRRQCANGTTELLQYDEEGRLEGRLTFRLRGGSSWWGTRYEYSAEGDLLEVSDSIRGATRFEVDAAHRLVAQTLPGGVRHAYVLDAAQNLVSKPGLGRVQLDTGNRLLATAAERFQYNDRNHVATREGTEGSSVRYGYDSFDMLVRIEWIRPGGTLLRRWEATYDAVGRRLWSRCGETQREFYWDGDSDPVWKRLKRVYGFYKAEDSVVGLAGRGRSVGNSSVAGAPASRRCRSAPGSSPGR
jgi:YD repeat-containing protein